MIVSARKMMSLYRDPLRSVFDDVFGELENPLNFPADVFPSMGAQRAGGRRRGGVGGVGVGGLITVNCYETDQEFRVQCEVKGEVL